MFTEFLSKIGKIGKICVKTNFKRSVKMLVLTGSVPGDINRFRVPPERRLPACCR